MFYKRIHLLSDCVCNISGVFYIYSVCYVYGVCVCVISFLCIAHAVGVQGPQLVPVFSAVCSVSSVCLLCMECV